jgi:hypothetical protein
VVLMVAVWMGPTKRSQYSVIEIIILYLKSGVCGILRLRSMLIVVAKAEGFATAEPLLAVVVAFS